MSKLIINAGLVLALACVLGILYGTFGVVLLDSLGFQGWYQ